MIKLLSEQIEALRQIQELCQKAKAEVVIIGAIAYQFWITDNRQTFDLDLTVALDLDAFEMFAAQLRARGWGRDDRREHRWYSPQNVRVDLMPAGEKLRNEGSITWPESKMVMSLKGFEHAFDDSVEVELAPDLRFRVISLRTFALLKVVAYLDDPTRLKDLEDFAHVLREYENNSDRRFSGAVIDAEVNYDAAGAFLLGQDLRQLCNNEEATLVMNCITVLEDQYAPARQIFLRAQPNIYPEEQAEREATELIASFKNGFQQPG
jgi:predicted nucleotidyltransferase